MSENNEQTDTMIANLHSAINEGNAGLSNVPGLIIQVIEAGCLAKVKRGAREFNRMFFHVR